MKPATLAPVTVLMRKIENDISGSCRPSSTATNEASSTAAVAKRPIVRADDQPKSFALVIASTVSDRPDVTSTAPAASKLLAHASRLSERRNGVATIAPTATGTLMKKIHSQLSRSDKTRPAPTP